MWARTKCTHAGKSLPWEDSMAFKIWHNGRQKIAVRVGMTKLLKKAKRKVRRNKRQARAAALWEKQQVRKRDPLAAYADEMRKRPTPAEDEIRLALGRIGDNFVQQYIVGKRIIDFYLPDRFVAIEADGGHHYTPEGIAADAARQKEILRINPRIVFLRYKNHDIVGNHHFWYKLRADIRRVASALI